MEAYKILDLSEESSDGTQPEVPTMPVDDII